MTKSKVIDDALDLGAERKGGAVSTWLDGTCEGWDFCLEGTQAGRLPPSEGRGEGESQHSDSLPGLLHGVPRLSGLLGRVL